MSFNRLRFINLSFVISSVQPLLFLRFTFNLNLGVNDTKWIKFENDFLLFYIRLILQNCSNTTHFCRSGRRNWAAVRNAKEEPIYYCPFKSALIDCNNEYYKKYIFNTFHIKSASSNNIIILIFKTIFSQL